MIVSYNDYKLNENFLPEDNIDTILVTIMQNLYENEVLSESDMYDLFDFINESIESYNIDIPLIISNNLDLFDEFVHEDEYYYSLTKRGIDLYESELNELELSRGSSKNWLGKDQGKRAWKLKMGSGPLGAASKMASGAFKKYQKGQNLKAKLADKKANTLLKHDYKMAKLSAKSKDNAFDSYQKLSGSHNARTY